MQAPGRQGGGRPCSLMAVCRRFCCIDLGTAARFFEAPFWAHWDERGPSFSDAPFRLQISLQCYLGCGGAGPNFGRISEAPFGHHTDQEKSERSYTKVCVRRWACFHPACQLLLAPQVPKTGCLAPDPAGRRTAVRAGTVTGKWRVFVVRNRLRFEVRFHVSEEIQ